ncbi:MAG: type II toxin-antitoxin system VapC family toxin [Acidobacteriota bacterium]
MIVLLDTDVLVDVALDRAPYSKPAGDLVDTLELRPGSAFVAWHTISNFYYLVAPSRGRDGARSFLLDLATFVDVSPTTTESLRFAGGLKMKRFEDAMQVAAALACRADVIATRNLRDYANAPIRAAKPESLIDALL